MALDVVKSCFTSFLIGVESFKGAFVLKLDMFLAIFVEFHPIIDG